MKEALTLHCPEMKQKFALNILDIDYTNNKT